MRVIFACAIAALLAAPQVVLAAKDGPDDAAAATPQGGWLRQASRALGDYNSRNAPGLYRACESVGLCKSVEKDDTEPPKPKRQCLGTEGANGECQLLAEAVCAAYPSSDEAEAAAATPAIGLQSIVAVTTSPNYRGMYGRVVEKENQKRKKTDRSKWKVKDSNGEDALVYPAQLRAVSNEEEKAFKVAETKADKAKAAEQELPKRLGNAPPIMPGVIVGAEPSDAEIKVVKDPMQKAMCASGYNLPRQNYRDANRKLLDIPVDSLIYMYDGAKCEIARRESKECERSYKQADVKKLSKRKKLFDPASKTTRQTRRSRRRVDGVTRECLNESYSRRSRDGRATGSFPHRGILCEQRTWWNGLDKETWHKPDALISGKELNRRALRTAAASREETRKRHEESTPVWKSNFGRPTPSTRHRRPCARWRET